MYWQWCLLLTFGARGQTSYLSVCIVRTINSVSRSCQAAVPALAQFATVVLLTFRDDVSLSDKQD
jgi:hypothetical protein